MTLEEKEICAQWWADRLEVEDKKEKFKQSLFDKLDDNMILRVDYDPDDILLEAIHEAGIKCRGCLYSAKGILPYKTHMKIRCYGENNITVKVGYGQADEVLI